MAAAGAAARAAAVVIASASGGVAVFEGEIQAPSACSGHQGCRRSSRGHKGQEHPIVALANAISGPRAVSGMRK